MIIPGFIVATLTFPGVIVHELAHQLFCRWTGTAVLDVCYFRPSNPAGYVVHEAPRSGGKHLLISIAPFFVNSILGAIIAAPAAIAAMTFSSPTFIDMVLIWLGVSIAMHAFPSTGDARSLWSALKHAHTAWVWKVLIAPIVGIIFVGAVGSFFWLDVIYGVMVAVAGPNLLIKSLL